MEEAFLKAPPMSEPRTWIGTNEAARRAGVHQSTLIGWCQKVPGLGRRVRGTWRVDPDVLDRVLAGELADRRGAA